MLLHATAWLHAIGVEIKRLASLFISIICHIPHHTRINHDDILLRAVALTKDFVVVNVVVQNYKFTHILSNKHHTHHLNKNMFAMLILS